MVRRRAFRKVGVMKQKYRKYTKSYMKYLRFVHTEYKKPEFKKILCRGFFGFWDYEDWDYTKTKRESRMLGYYYDRILGIMNFLRNINEDSGTH